MKAVNDSHLRAIARAVHFVRSGMTHNMTPKMLNSIQHDIYLLDEAHKYIRQQISEPGLPMMHDVPDTVTNEDSDGHSDKATAV